MMHWTIPVAFVGVSAVLIWLIVMILKSHWPHLFESTPTSQKLDFVVNDAEYQAKLKVRQQAHLDELAKTLAPPEDRLVLVFTDKCGHCRKLKPMFSRFAMEHSDRILMVNGNEKKNHAFMKANGISTVPKIGIERNGKIVEFHRLQDEGSIRLFAERHKLW